MRSLQVTIICAAIAALLATSCGGGEKQRHEHLRPGHYPDTLRVGTLYSPTSYFLYREDTMGYDYTIARQLAADKNAILDMQVFPSMEALITGLDSGNIDIAAYPIPVTGQFRQRVIACGPRNENFQVLVQPRRATTPLISDVTELIGREIYTEADSKYYYRMLNLNDELGGGIDIRQVDLDSVITEDLMRMVADGEIPLTVVDNDIARVNATYFPGLDMSLAVSFPQRSQWAVATPHQWLADSIDAWIDTDRQRQSQERLMKRYFELAKNEPATVRIDLSRGHISPYDHLFRRYAATINYDWRLLASQGYIESHYDSTKVSWAGARGIMQIMPGTSRAYHVAPEHQVHPETAIRTASLILSDLDKSLKELVPDTTERHKFILAAYNAGLAHIYDAIALAHKYNYDPTVWDNNVSHCLLLKSKEEYYTDPVVKWGYFSGRQTVAYVDEVSRFYTRCKQYIDP